MRAQETENRGAMQQARMRKTGAIFKDVGKWMLIAATRRWQQQP